MLLRSMECQQVTWFFPSLLGASQLVRSHSLCWDVGGRDTPSGNVRQNHGFTFNTGLNAHKVSTGLLLFSAHSESQVSVYEHQTGANCSGSVSSMFKRKPESTSGPHAYINTNISSKHYCIVSTFSPSFNLCICLSISD